MQPRVHRTYWLPTLGGVALMACAAPRAEDPDIVRPRPGEPRLTHLPGPLLIFNSYQNALIDDGAVYAISSTDGRILRRLFMGVSPRLLRHKTRERPGPWAMVGGGIILLATAWRTVLGARRTGASLPKTARESPG